ncbi:MAG: tetrahydromethanopterin S-methyltransferase subunit H [archaeon]|nr:tetrahydromethanopterin S-methyltransferase subunit H [archaeon]
MFKFDKEQTVFDFAGVKMGGQPGEYPTVLCGTIFYGGHNIVNDELTGDFDKERAEDLLLGMIEISETTGNPCIAQVFGQTEEAIVKYLDFVGDICDLPMLIDSTSGDARVAGARFVDEVGLTERAIYNSINMAAEKSELEALKESKIDASIILGFNPMNATVPGKIAMWENGDDGAYEKGLLEVAADCGITKFMMDTAVTPLGQGAGVAGRATFAEKAKWGYPVGSGIHNIPSAWDWLRDYKNETGNKTAFKVCDIGANILQVMTGGDFVLFGPIDNADICFPAIAQTDMFIAEAAKDLGTEAIESHPINNLL